MFVLLAGLTLVQADPKVTLDLPIQSLASVVRTVADRTGRPLTVSPSLSREMVRVRVQNVSLTAFLPRLAQCTYGQWVQDGDRLRLERQPGVERTLLVAARKRAVEGLRQSLDEIVKEELSTPYDPAGAAQMLRKQVDDWTPHAATEMFVGVPPDVIRAIQAIRDADK